MLHLEDEANEWWFHGLSTLAHESVTAYEKFTWRLVEIFYERDPYAQFFELAKLKQSRNPETYIFELLKLSVMVPDLSTARRVYMFIDGLAEPSHGMVKSTRPTILQDAIERARDLQDSFLRTRAQFQQKPSFQSKGKDMKVPPSKGNQEKGSLSDDFHKYLSRRKICFTCQEPWAPGHRCAIGKAHNIEVLFDSEEEEKDDLEGYTSALGPGGDPSPPGGGNGAFYPTGGALVALRGVPKYLTLRF